MVIVTGADGYIGWPTMLKLSKSFPKERIVGIDHFGRRKWVENIGSVSAIPVADMKTRINAAREWGFSNLHFIEGDLTDKNFTYEILQVFKPKVIIHLAAQPSAPFSHINGQMATFTQENNNGMLRNILWGMKESGLTDTHLITTTTTGVYGAPEFTIPEGFLSIKNEETKQTDIIPYPGMATSWYHMSKANDINNLYLAHHLWKLPITDIRTSIVLGTETSETKIDSRLATRFDFDFYFGVVPNRFCAQALANHPITIYGKGEQKKPMITLEDAVISIVNAADMEKDATFEVFNQASIWVSPKDLALAVQQACQKVNISVNIIHIENPRKEKEVHEMKMQNSGFLSKLLKKSPQSLQEGIDHMIQSLLPFRETIIQYQSRFLN
ncbi:NAD-dependent epimerase/dehydratase family protein [Microaerobacter geothermalis]|uniref:NAD-dependent epimerase/dehydratase family protein n=1 Tax=Microaerobacter geothermalis TaxID=674972 RepID=UPI001F3159C6|nr:NAD-dependent epimerase/dehydratase family protein [Microaerobacter geothermalis]MCF6093320.1 NAD-dependent epimerase/dehydratase family protein [Microaerobacter geothermalis]